MNRTSTAISLHDWNSELVSAWQAHAAEPDDGKNLNRLGNALDATMRSLRPAPSMGPLCDHMEDLRQDAHVMLLHGGGVFSRRQRKHPVGYLAGNTELRSATTRGDEIEIRRQLIRSILAVLGHCGRRLRRKLARERTQSVPLEKVSPEHLGTIAHSSDRVPSDLPSDIQRELVRSLLEEASKENRLAAGTLKLAARILADGERSADVARELNVSRQALHQRLQPVRRWLTRRSHNMEMPLS